MALTLQKEQRLTAVKLVEFYEAGKGVWDAAAKEAFEYVKKSFPHNANIRPDDVSKALEPVLEVNQSLRAKLNERKLTQKYWVGYFAELILDRAWADVTGP
ncbi:Uncharacterized protein MLTONO_4108 [Mesorhizobium loti]|nr:Uncharacterized protein MLTONO_4108 [Mesorhizobium loti]